MRIGKHPAIKRRIPSWWPAALLLFIAIVGFGLALPGEIELIRPDSLLWCDAESISNIKGKQSFSDQEHAIAGAGQQDETMALSGRYSCKVDTAHPEGFVCRLALEADKVYEVSVWRRSLHGYGLLGVKGLSGFKYSAKEGDAVEARPDGWEKLSAKVRVPLGQENTEIEIRTLHGTDFAEPVWFDDLMVREIPGARTGPCSEELVQELRNTPISGYSVEAYRLKSGDEQDRIALRSFHPLQLSIVGYGAHADASPSVIGQPPLLPAFGQIFPPQTVEIDVPSGTTHLFFSLQGATQLHQFPIQELNIPGGKTSRQEMFVEGLPLKRPCYDIEGKTIRFRPGQFEIRKTVVIPEGWEVYFPAGCNLDFLEGAGFISESPVRMEGRLDSPVVLLSSDGSATGFSVLASSGRSELTNVQFKNFGALETEDWRLSGAVTFYGHDVRMSQVNISGNKSEDALKLIRCQIEMDGIEIKDTPIKGLVADYCEGTIQNAHFQEIGSDGLKISGGDVQTSNISGLEE